MQLKSLAEKLVKDRIIAVPPQVWEEKEYDDTDATRLSKDSETACMCCARPECVRIFVTQTCMTLHMRYTSSAVHNLLRHGRNRLVHTLKQGARRRGDDLEAPWLHLPRVPRRLLVTVWQWCSYWLYSIRFERRVKLIHCLLRSLF